MKRVVSASVLDALHLWFAKQQEKLSTLGLKIELVRSGEGAQSAQIEFESASLLGRATVWRAGFCDLELLNIELDSQILYSHHDQITPCRLKMLLDEFAMQMLNMNP
jgi:hypothetical protein